MKPHHFICIFAAMLASYAGLHYYLARWVVRHFDLSPIRTKIVKYFFLALAVAFPAAAYINRMWHAPAAEILYCLAALWFGVFLIWSAAAFTSDIVQFLLRLSGLSRARLTGHVVLIIVVLLSAFAFYEGNRPARVKEIHVELPNLPLSLDGFSIVQVADLHLHGRHSLKRLRRIMDSLNKLTPDLIALCGDIVEPGFRHTGELKAMMNSIGSRYTIVGVMGNHEFYFGRRRAAEVYRECGIRLLQNEVIKLKCGLQIAGVDDIRTAGMTDREVENVLKKLDPHAPSIYLSHQPLKFHLASKHKVGLMLSGHTHKGQIFPAHFFVRLFYRYFYGLFREGDSFLYVTSGCGTWGPFMRLFASSELPHFILHPPGNTRSTAHISNHVSHRRPYQCSIANSYPIMQPTPTLRPSWPTSPKTVDFPPTRFQPTFIYSCGIRTPPPRLGQIPSETITLFLKRILALGYGRCAMHHKTGTTQFL